MEIIYLDNNATTKIDPRVLDSMMPFLVDQYSNASSSHLLGRKVNESIKKARIQVADLLSCAPKEITFTSGATEAINIAIKGIAESYKNKGKHIITVNTEHPAVLDTCKYLETIGYDVTYLQGQTNGLVDLNLLEQNIRNDTILVSVMYVNNETGVIQPIKDIAEIAHSKGTLFMTDATQAVGKVKIDVTDLGIDLLCLSAHKFYGPKGIGALYINNNDPVKIKIAEQTHGGRQENGLRSGTLNVPGIIGLGTASEIASKELEFNKNQIKQIRDYFETELLKIEYASLNGDLINRLYNVTNICFKGIDADTIINGLKNIMVSNGSACSSSIIEASHVLLAMGLNNDEALSSIRFSLGKYNTKEEIETVLTDIKKLIAQLRAGTIL